LDVSERNQREAVAAIDLGERGVPSKSVVWRLLALLLFHSPYLKVRNSGGVTMTAATITSKGQVTIPVDVRNQLGLQSGDRIEFSFNEETGRYEVYPATRSLASLKGIVKKPAKPVSVDDMNRAIAEQGASAR
jgi:antitoxin PrlF